MKTEKPIYHKFGARPRILTTKNKEANGAPGKKRIIVKAQDAPDFIRVQDDYYEVFEAARRFGPREVIQHRKKQELRQDHGEQFLKDVQKFKTFCMIPDNINYKRVHGDCYNMYSPFSHQPKQGSTKVTEMFLKHIFGEQYELGIEYLDVLYERPCQMMPVVVLVSKMRNTGKTTFINWLSTIFGDNLVSIDPDALTNQFNHSYATKNIICLDETIIDKTSAVERIKRIATCKEILVNTKYVSQYTIDFYGKIILLTNSEKNFMKVDQEEIRFWVRKLPKIENEITDIEEKLKNEIPAFLYMLKERKWIYPKKATRMHFPIDVLNNDQLKQVKAESRSWLYKELQEHFTEWFYNNSGDIIATPKELKKEYFSGNNQVPLPFIRKTLRDEFELVPSDRMRYFSTFDAGVNKVMGRPYTITRAIFEIDEIDETDGKLPF